MEKFRVFGVLSHPTVPVCVESVERFVESD